MISLKKSEYYKEHITNLTEEMIKSMKQQTQR